MRACVRVCRGVLYRVLRRLQVCALALVALLTCPDDSLPPEVRAGLPQVLAGTLRLLVALKEQQVQAGGAGWGLAVVWGESGGWEWDGQRRVWRAGADALAHACTRSRAPGPHSPRAAALQDEAAAAAEEDEDDEDEDADDAWDADDEDGGAASGGDEDEDPAGNKYLARLEKEARELAGVAAGGSDSDDEWTDDEEVQTPLDPVDPFVALADALAAAQHSHPARYQATVGALDVGAQAALQAVVTHAEQQRTKQPQQ